MYSPECTLRGITYSANNIGVQTETLSEETIPIMKVEDVYANEFYQADEQGYKPTLRLRISSLNYNGEQELEYMNKIYTVIRTQTPVPDEIILVCERKVKHNDVSFQPSPI